MTLAEIAPTLDDYPDADPAMLRAGSAVFHPTAGPVYHRDHASWWHHVFGANWRDPDGIGRRLADRLDHPVVHIAYQDALAYADWAARCCRPKPNGNMPRAAAGRTRNSLGETNSSLAER
jgi:sulfatase modifying factor 1